MEVRLVGTRLVGVSKRGLVGRVFKGGCGIVMGGRGVPVGLVRPGPILLHDAANRVWSVQWEVLISEASPLDLPFWLVIRPTPPHLTYLSLLHLLTRLPQQPTKCEVDRSGHLCFYCIFLYTIVILYNFLNDLYIS